MNLGLSPDKCSLVLGIDSRVVCDLFASWRAFLVPIIERLNAEMVIGAQGQDIELDEVAFRSKALENSVFWVRFLAVVRRGSSKVSVHQLPSKLVVEGQGGGGAITLPELVTAVQPGSDRWSP